MCERMEVTFAGVVLVAGVVACSDGDMATQIDADPPSGTNDAASSDSPPSPYFRHLDVQKEGTGSGTIASVPPAISCGSSCSAVLPFGQFVRLDVSVGADSVFLGWTGDCDTLACTLTMDSDKSVTARFARAGEDLWTRAVGGPGIDSVSAVGVDDAGDVIVAGTFTGAADVAGITVVGDPSSVDVFVAKLSGIDGTAIWANRVGAEGVDDGVSALQVDQHDTVLAGTYSGTLEIGSTSLTALGPEEAFILKLDSVGSTNWAIRIGGPGASVRLTDVDLNVFGDVWVAGSYQGSFEYAYEWHASANGSEDVFVAELDGVTGGVGATFTAGGIGRDRALGIGADSVNSAYVFGDFEGSLMPGLSSVGPSDLFVMKLSQGGGIWQEWVKQFGGEGLAEAGDAALFEFDESIIIAGDFSSSIDFGGPTLVAAGGMDAFIARLDELGDHVWSKRFGGPGDDVANGIAVDSTGAVAVTGFFTETASFGGESLTSAGGTDGFVARVNPSGTLRFTTRFGGVGDDSGARVGIAPFQWIALGGTFEQTIDFGLHMLESAGWHDGIAVLLYP